MAENQDSLLTGKRVGVILILTFLFHMMMTNFLRPHVPTDSAAWQWVWAFFSATPLTGSFFLAASMFTMVLVDQRKRSNVSSHP